MNLREIYGMTENFGGFTLMPEYRHKPNTVGKPMPGSKGKIDEESGEIRSILLQILSRIDEPVQGKINVVSPTRGWEHREKQAYRIAPVVVRVGKPKSSSLSYQRAWRRIVMSGNGSGSSLRNEIDSDD